MYTTLGRECGCSGHRHPTVQQAGRRLEDYRPREFSDRIVVGVAADAAWSPSEGPYLNHAELEALDAPAQVVENKVETDYARSDPFERRRRLMDDWAADKRSTCLLVLNSASADHADQVEL